MSKVVKISNGGEVKTPKSGGNQGKHRKDKLYRRTNQNGLNK